MKTNGNDFKNWMNHGTQIQILIRRIMIIGLIALMIYGTGYAILYFILRNLRIFIIFAEKGLETIRKHAEDFVAKRLAAVVDVSSNGIIYLPEDS